MKLLHSCPIANQSTTFTLPQGQWGGFIIEYAVTTDTAKTGTLASCGNVILSWNGSDVINVDAEILNHLNNIYGGVAETTLATAGSNRIMVYVPCGLWFDHRNIYDIGQGDRVTFKLDFSVLTGLTAGVGSVNIYGKNKIGEMQYLHKIVSRFVVAGGASVISDNYPTKNISQVYLKNPAGSNVTDIQISKDGETVVDAKPALLLAYSANIHLLETASTTLAIDMGESKDVRENVGSEVSYKYTFSGAGTLSQYFSYIEFTPVKQKESRVVAGNKLTRKIQNAMNR